jgi:leucyl/phenylalanyl-tRNA--protein transferase
MPVYALTDDFRFPPASHAEPDGLLAVGGDLKPQRLLNAYCNGIFPWYSAGDPILWYAPDPRLVVFPEKLVVHKSMRPILRSGRFTITYDTAFREVMEHCATQVRHGQDGTWIQPETIAAFSELHRMGFAHSVEVWEAGKLVGGLYGLALGRTFCGESMFARVSNASKVGFIHLVSGLQALGFQMIDCQQSTAHLASLGGVEIPLSEFIRRMHASLDFPPLEQHWNEIPELRSPKLF